MLRRDAHCLHTGWTPAVLAFFTINGFVQHWQHLAFKYLLFKELTSSAVRDFTLSLSTECLTLSFQSSVLSRAVTVKKLRSSLNLYLGLCPVSHLPQHHSWVASVRSLHDEINIYWGWWRPTLTLPFGEICIWAEECSEWAETRFVVDFFNEHPHCSSDLRQQVKETPLALAKNVRRLLSEKLWP